MLTCKLPEYLRLVENLFLQMLQPGLQHLKINSKQFNQKPLPRKNKISIPPISLLILGLV